MRIVWIQNKHLFLMEWKLFDLNSFVWNGHYFLNDNPTKQQHKKKEEGEKPLA